MGALKPDCCSIEPRLSREKNASINQNASLGCRVECLKGADYELVIRYAITLNIKNGAQFLRRYAKYQKLSIK